MWPSRKKAEQEPGAPTNFETVICIPGNWNDWDEFMLSIVAATNGDYIAAGGFLINAKSKRHYTVEFCDHDSRIRAAFRHTGSFTGVTESFLNEIGDHRHVLYLSGQTGNLEEARHIAFAAEAILKAGGTGIKIETAGKAFEKDNWCNILQSFEESDLYELFVVDSITNKDGSVFSCGMQNLGYKDCIVYGEPIRDAVKLITIFSYYQIIDKPTITAGQTFSAEVGAPVYRITDEPEPPYKGNELFGNPNGMWRLTKEQI